MGQKVHPGGMRVGVIHDWKSNWYTGNEGVRRLHPRGHQDPRAHLQEALARGPVRHPDPQGQAADHRRHLHRAAGHRDRQVGRRGRRAAQGAARDHAEERPHQHQRDQASRARREARRAVDRGAAPEPRQLPSRDEARAGLGDALRRAGRPHPLRRPAGRRRDEPLRDVLRGPRAAAHDPRRHRLRLRRGEDDLRPHRRQGLDQQGRDHAGGLRADRRRARTRGSASRIRRAGAAAHVEGLGASRESGRGRAAATARASARCAGAAGAAAVAGRRPAVVPAAQGAAAAAAGSRAAARRERRGATSSARAPTTRRSRPRAASSRRSSRRSRRRRRRSPRRAGHHDAASTQTERARPKQEKARA